MQPRLALGTERTRDAATAAGAMRRGSTGAVGRTATFEDAPWGMAGGFRGRLELKTSGNDIVIDLIYIYNYTYKPFQAVIFMVVLCNLYGFISP